MFSNTIAAQFTDNNDWAFGAALSLVMMAVVLGILFLTGRSIGVQNVFLGSRHGQ
jgi:ABC-type spermidine/putrescine transport system permease subunit I